MGEKSKADLFLGMLREDAWMTGQRESAGRHGFLYGQKDESGR